MTSSSARSAGDIERLASDPSATPEALRRLSHQVPRVWHLLARNPATPTEVLLRIPFEAGAGHLLQNPVFPFLLLDDPSLSGATAALRCGLARHPDTPVELLWALSEGGLPELLALAQNPRLPGELREKIVSPASSDLRLLLARASPLPELFHRYLLSDASQRVRHWASQTIGACKTCRPWRALLRQAQRCAEGHAPRPLSLPQQRELLAGGVWARVLLARQPWLDEEIRFVLSQDVALQVQRTLRRSAAPAPGNVEKYPVPRGGSLRHEPRCRQKGWRRGAGQEE
ncbi:MAG: hypothetical protein MUF64_30450 [Polyangiaceae bacterium]|nr:hypothetical protein [Polyangiaceae bacterium]